MCSQHISSHINTHVRTNSKCCSHTWRGRMSIKPHHSINGVFVHVMRHARNLARRHQWLTDDNHKMRPPVGRSLGFIYDLSHGCRNSSLSANSDLCEKCSNARLPSSFVLPISGHDLILSLHSNHPLFCPASFSITSSSPFPNLSNCSNATSNPFPPP